MKTLDTNCVLFESGDELSELYILAEGSVDIFLQTDDFYCVLNSVNKPGCVFGQYMAIDSKQMINYSIRIVKQARFITVDRKSIYQMCNQLPDMRE